MNRGEEKGRGGILEIKEPVKGCGVARLWELVGCIRKEALRCWSRI